MIPLESIADPVARERERVLRQLVGENKARHKLPGLTECIRFPGEPSIREKTLREFAEQQASDSLV